MYIRYMNERRGNDYQGDKGVKYQSQVNNVQQLGLNASLTSLNESAGHTLQC